MDQVKNYLPMLFRYLLASAMAALTTRGLMSPESAAIISPHTDAIVSFLVLLVTVTWAIVKKPSAKAMEVAQKVDAEIPKEDDVTIKTPGAAPDIVVQASK